MPSPELLLAALFLVLVAVLTLLPAKAEKQPRYRTLNAIDTLRNAMADSIESGKRIHLGIGNGMIFSASNAPALANYETYRKLQQLSISSDKPAILTAVDPVNTLIGQDLARAIARSRQQNSLYHPAVSRLAGVSPFSYALGAGLQQKSDDVRTVLLLGDYGPEGIYPLQLAGDKSTSVAASSNLTGQAVMLAAATSPLLAEEIFAVPAYFSDKPSVRRIPRVLDTLRWVVIFAICAGVLAQLLAVMMVAK